MPDLLVIFLRVAVHMSDGGSSMAFTNTAFTSPAFASSTEAKSAWSGRLRGMTGRIDSFFLPLETVFLTTGSRLRELSTQATLPNSAR